MSEFCQSRRQIALDQADCSASLIVKGSLASTSLPGICRAALIIRFRDFLAPSLGTARPNYCPVEVGIILHVVLYSSSSNANISFTFCANYHQLRYHPVDIDKFFWASSNIFWTRKRSYKLGLSGAVGSSQRKFSSHLHSRKCGHFQLTFHFRDRVTRLFNTCLAKPHLIGYVLTSESRSISTGSISLWRITPAGSEAHCLHKTEQALSMAR